MTTGPIDRDAIAFSNVNKSWRYEQLFLVTDTYVWFNPASIRNGFLQSEKELIFDFFCIKYKQQTLLIEAGDGENLKECGLYDFLERLIEHGLLLREKVLIRTHDTHFSENFPHKILPPGLLWTTPIAPGDFSVVNDSAKFVGITVGRFTPPRYRLVRELYTAFGQDTFLVFNPDLWNCERFFNRIDSDNGTSYQDEIDWLKTYKFDKDELVNYNLIHRDISLLTDSLSSYHSFWPKYQIEMVAETDALSDHWFTEKSGRVLQTGKPFMLLSGKHSLKRLKETGFLTFDSVIDESYDDEYMPPRRVFKMIDSLKELYSSPDRDQRIKKMYEIGKINKKLFTKLSRLHHHIYHKENANDPLQFPTAYQNGDTRQTPLQLT